MGYRHFVLWLSVPLFSLFVLFLSFPEAQDSSTSEDSTLRIPQLSFSSEVALEAVVDSSKVPLNRPLTLTIRASCRGDMNQYEFQWPDPPDLNRFEIVGSSSANIVTDKSGHLLTVKEFRYILEPIGQGTGRIGPVTLLYTNKSTQKEYSLSTRAVGVEITEPVERSASGLTIYLLVIIGLVTVVLLAGGLIYVKKRRKVEEGPTPLVETKIPEEMALEELEKVPELRLSGETKEYYSAISNTLRRYIDRTFTLRTSELTTHDIINSLRLKEVEEEISVEIEKILSICDMVKFAGHEPSSSDLDQILSMAQDFFKSRMAFSTGDVNEGDEEKKRS